MDGAGDRDRTDDIQLGKLACSYNNQELICKTRRLGPQQHQGVRTRAQNRPRPPDPKRERRPGGGGGESRNHEAAGQQLPEDNTSNRPLVSTEIKTASRVTAPSRSTIAVYNGRELLGYIHENGDGKHHAVAWPDGRKLGAFETRKEAADAVTRAAGALS
jgi:hypothetical protein